LPAFTIRRGRAIDGEPILRMIDSLARFERLEPPDPAAKRRMLRDLFKTKRLNLFVAKAGTERVGYALYFFTYSSFLARPTLYLEDLFVLEQERHRGIGKALFMACVREAVREGCGRMEWAVLTWNRNAIEFYEEIGAKRLGDWYVYRLDSGTLGKLAAK